MTLLIESRRRDGFMEKGEWRGARPAGEGARRSATVCCPGCGKIASLTDHAIDANGAASPSLACPFDCGFHDHVRLAGWKA